MRDEYEEDKTVVCLFVLVLQTFLTTSNLKSGVDLILIMGLEMASLLYKPLTVPRDFARVNLRKKVLIYF